ncbi:MAG: N-acetyl-gamma-glutamyl-phosphate reductase [Chloroflexota bacterium]
MYERSILANGLRVVTAELPHTRSATVSIYVGAGSRYERDEEAGLSHFLEHMLFKGASRRPTAREISEAIESVGGVHNAATDREATLYYAKVPHTAAMTYAQKLLAAGVRVIDLSADFRLKSPAAYKAWYAHDHLAPELLHESVYGLVEVNRAQIKHAKLIANPGCYPTCAILGIYPLAKAGLLDDAPIIIDAKSGVSGAGRKPSLTTHFVEANENLSPYNIGHAHRHVPEIEQEISLAAGAPKKIIFAPHLLPINQGLLSTIYVQPKEQMDTNALIGLYRQTYEAEPFVKVLPPGKFASLCYVIGNNQCVISLTAVNGTAIVVSALDNLIKGASGQAVQNMNVMFGIEETTGLI